MTPVIDAQLIELLRSADHIAVLTGAGVSAERPSGEALPQLVAAATE